MAAYAVGVGTQLLALEQIPPSVHETSKRAIGMLGALVVGSVAFRERVTRPRVLAVLGMLLGVGLVLL